jgi:retron-type reverse transcriptase
MDFEDFFNSICPSDLLAHLERERHGVSDNDKFAVRQLFFYQPTQHGPYLLSVGAPSSPFISNTILFEFDSQLSEYCKNEGIVYTRYADDLTFSTNEKGALFAIPNIVTKILAELPFPKIGINAEKTIFSSKRHNRHVTGLVITNDGRLSIGRSKKREIRSLIYQYLEDKLEVDRIGYLRGMLSYIADVEPNFLVSLERKYGKDKMVGLVKNI